ncbi:hypothetical protein HPB48_009289 [Haemaphysalis longicornis]|uniref:Uncharacterized protein n=1 Tax=Haemaphysalis longicornis TaxID=44386 RepID=A0A9J6H4G4_HAELO|nr:hypothetical protein HPB48_009289 [Haemaphysalis longicornis]
MKRGLLAFQKGIFFCASSMSYLVTITFAASARTPQGTALRVLSATWWIAIVVLMNAFAGQMRACLMVKTELQKVNTVSDIAARPYLKVHLLKGTVLTRYFEVINKYT